MTNTILAYNTGIDSDNYRVISQNCIGSVADGGHNLSSDATCFSLPDLFIDPHLAPLGDYGGPTATMALCTGWGTPYPTCTGRSPAIDAGSDSVTGPPLNIGQDQRGQPRKADLHVDIGAYEVQHLEEPASGTNACVGDCNGDGSVSIDELLAMAHIALFGTDVAMCPTGDANHDGVITVDEILAAVNHALQGRCTSLGQDCSDSSECLSGFCTDSVCCSTGTCSAGQSCDVFGAEGSCSTAVGNVTALSPSNQRSKAVHLARP